jgi:N-methylhydantoinase B/oxoprolinase/acetone carboxylase alpha subunit
MAQGGSAGSGPGATITVNASARGWYKDTGEHDSANENTLTGWSYSGDYAQHRSYLTFQLPSFTGTVSSVTLRVEHEWYASPDASETVAMYDVLTAAAALDATPPTLAAGIPIFTDLGSGTTYGSFTLTSATMGSPGMILVVPLAASGASAVSSARGTAFSIGLVLTMHSASPNVNEFVRFSFESEARTHELVITTTPAG